jgi:hypothetical protein
MHAIARVATGHVLVSAIRNGRSPAGMGRALRGLRRCGRFAPTIQLLWGQSTMTSDNRVLLWCAFIALVMVVAVAAWTLSFGPPVLVEGAVPP